MAGYVKIWTFIEDEPWFQELGCAGRNILFHLIIHAKKGADNGTVAYGSYHDLGSTVSVSRNTCVKVLSQLSQLGVIEYSKSATGKLTIFLPKYVKWQEMTVTEAIAHLRSQRSNLNPDIPPTIPDQTRPEQSKPKQCKPPKKKVTEIDPKKEVHVRARKWFCDEFEKRTGAKYHFKGGKDGQSLKRMIAHHDELDLKGIFEMVFNTQPREVWDISLIFMKINSYAATYFKTMMEKDNANNEHWLKQAGKVR